MKNKRIWLVVSCLVALSLSMASCAPAAVEEEEKKEAVPPEEEAASPVSPASPTTPEQIEASDSQVTIVLDRLERADTVPSGIAEELDDIPTPAAGSEFVCIYLRISRIENIHMVDPLGYEEEKAVLFDAQGHEYKPKWAKVTGIRLVDPSDFEGSPYEVVEGATGFLVFVVPKAEKPSKLEFVYSFKATWEEEAAKRGQIDLILGDA